MLNAEIFLVENNMPKCLFALHIILKWKHFKLKLKGLFTKAISWKPCKEVIYCIYYLFDKGDPSY